MKKTLTCLLALIMVISLVTGCGAKGKTQDDSDKLSVVCTIFPIYDWVKEIMGDKFKETDVTLLLDNGVDLHSYQPSAEDIVKISKCDVFIYVGGESDRWVEGALKEATNPNMVVINLMDVLGDNVKPEEFREGMQHDDHDHDHDSVATSDHDDHDTHHDNEGHDDHDHDYSFDEHIWLSLDAAEEATEYIAIKLSNIDPDNGEIYEANFRKYKEKLDNLDDKYKDVVSKAKNKTIVFGDRFPFRYMMDEYGIEYYAAFPGCSSETEAAFETVSTMARMIDQHNLTSIMTIEGSNQKVAKTIIKATSSKNQKILTLNSMQSVTEKEVSKGASYIKIMEENLSVIEEALN